MHVLSIPEDPMRLSRFSLSLLFLAPAILVGAGRLLQAAQTAPKTAAAAGAVSQAAADPEARPVAPGVVYQDEMTLVGPLNFRNGYPATTAEGTVTAVIEIPAGCTDKWEVKGEDGLLHWDVKNGKPRRVSYLGYPCNYGMVPRTVLSPDRGGDGDPLDVLVLGAAVSRGAVIEARVVGLLRMRDGGDLDVKLVAVRANTAFEDVKDVGDLDERFPGVTGILETWFAHYKGPGVVETDGFADTATALQTLQWAVQDYERMQRGS
jgi:inorganic pyrophosphatase